MPAETIAPGPLLDVMVEQFTYLVARCKDKSLTPSERNRIIKVWRALETPFVNPKRKAPA